MFNSNLASSDTWKEFNAGDLIGADIDLVALDPLGRNPRAIMMKAAGDLRVKDPNGTDRSVTGIAAWVALPIQAKTLLAAQTVPVIVFW